MAFLDGLSKYLGRTIGKILAIDLAANSEGTVSSPDLSESDDTFLKASEMEYKSSSLGFRLEF